jgi:protein MpaA
VLVGASVRGAPIEGERVGPGGDVQLLVFGAIHGDEPESAELCRRWLARLSTSAPPRDVVIVPVANPDGLAARTKDNAHGVDLNRNFAARSWVATHPPGYFPGAQPLSEPEAAAIAALVDALAPSVIVAVHQPFRCVNWDGPAASLASEMAALTGYPAVASVGYPTPGSFGACYGIDRGLPVITLELPRAVAESDYAVCLDALSCATMWRP